MKFTEYNEKKRHGTDEFPIEYYFVNEEHSQYIMPLHWHHEFEIVAVDSGRLDLHLDNVKYELEKGDIAFVECGTLHRATPYNCVYECLVFNINMLRGKKGGANDSYLMPIINHTAGLNCIHHSTNTELYETVSALFKAMKNEEPYYHMEVFALLYRIFLLLYRQGHVSEELMKHGNLHQTKVMTDLLDWLDNHYTEQITLGDLAAFSGLSEKYLCRVFKNYTSRTPIEYINYLRIDSACRDLQHSDCTITEAAFNNGFNNLSYFSKIFRKYKMESPRQYMKNHSGNV